MNSTEDHPRISALRMKQAQEIGEVRQRIWAEQAELRKTCGHPKVEIRNMEYQDEKMREPVRWREKRCVACDAAVEKEITTTHWVKTDQVGNPLRDGSKG